MTTPLEAAPTTDGDAGGSAASLAVHAGALVAAAAAAGALATRSQLLGVLVAAAVGALAGAVLAQRAPLAPVVALLGVGALLGSPLVQEGGSNAATLCAVLACAVAAVLSGRELQLPARPVAVALAAYVVVLLAATATSIARSTSVTYVAGTVAVLVVAFVAIPTLVQGAWARVLRALVAIACAIAASSAVLWVVGSVQVASQRLGVYYVLQLTVGGHTTSLEVPRASGIYLRPAGAGMTFALGCIAAMALAPGLVRRRRLVVGGAVAVTILAAVLTFARTAQIGIVVGGLVLLAVRRWRRDAVVVVGVAVMLVVTLAMAADRFGALDRLDVTLDRYGRAATESIVNDPSAIDASVGTKVRGGTDLSSRRALWTASVDALRDRPLLGSGPGTDATAITPHLSAQYASYAGLSSHSTPLRVAVESGVAGLLALLAVHVTSAWAAARRRAAWSWPLVALAAGAIGLGLTETLSFGGFVLASLVWTIALGALAATPSGLTPAGLLRRVRPATPGRGSEPAARPAPTPSRG